LRVREPDLSARRVDPHDPERPRLALLRLATAVREGPRAQDRLGGGLVELAPPAEVALRLLEDLLAPSARLRSTFCPWHSPTPPWCALQAVAGLGPRRPRRAYERSQIGNEHAQASLVRFVDQLALAQPAAALGVLALELLLLPAQLRVRHLAPFEAHRDLGLVAFLQEAPHVLQLEVEVVLLGLRTHLDFLDLDGRLLLARFLEPPGLRVLVLAEVHDTAHR